MLDSLRHRELLNYAQHYGQPNPFSFSRTLDYLRLRVFFSTNLESPPLLDNPEKRYTGNSPEIAQICSTLKRNKVLRVALGLEQGKQENMRFVGQILKLVGVKLKNDLVSTKIGCNTGGVRSEEVITKGGNLLKKMPLVIKKNKLKILPIGREFIGSIRILYTKIRL